MRIRTIPLLMIVLLVLGSTAAFAEGGTKHRDDHGKKGGHHKGVLVLHATETSATYITADGRVFTDEDEEEVDDLMPSAGDRFLLVDTLYSDEARTALVGRNDIECTVTAFSGTSEEDFSQNLLCHGVVTVDGAGTLAWQGAVQFSSMTEFDPAMPFATVAITGGTGQYLGASGQAKLFDTSTDDDESLTRYEVKLTAGRR
ncbi:hypothetical protein [Egicoccus sp. AB-alg6-2]|uniref:hypothetical protein n=1 Tax=Egicoccus sp. AB-alg6-2 TaxID=3242692 RepID=UPI00359DB1AA